MAPSLVRGVPSLHWPRFADFFFGVVYHTFFSLFVHFFFLFLQFIFVFLLRCVFLRQRGLAGSSRHTNTKKPPHVCLYPMFVSGAMRFLCRNCWFSRFLACLSFFPPLFSARSAGCSAGSEQRAY